MMNEQIELAKIAAQLTVVILEDKNHVLPKEVKPHSDMPVGMQVFESVYQRLCALILPSDKGI
jgi:hypothetical protein